MKSTEEAYRKAAIICEQVNAMVMLNPIDSDNAKEYMLFVRTVVTHLSIMDEAARKALGLPSKMERVSP